MNPVAGIQNDGTEAAAQLAQMASAFRGGQTGQNTLAVQQSSQSGSVSLTSSITTASQNLTQALSPSGEGSAAEQLLRTLVAVVVLLALLDQAQRGSNSMDRAAGLLALLGATDSRTQAASSYYSFYSYEQTSVSLTYTALNGYASSTPDAAPTSGGQLDYSA